MAGHCRYCATALIILSVVWWHWHAPTEAQQVDSYKVNAEGQLAPAQRSQPAIGDGAQ